jgi:anti-sigma factor RsiW
MEGELMSTAHVEEMIPWHVNGTLDADEAARVEAHLAQCEQCRASAQLEAQLVRLSRERRESVDLAPQFGWSRLAARLAPQETATGRREIIPRRWAFASGQGRWPFAGVLIGQAAALVLLAVAVVQLSSLRTARYVTLTDPVPEVSGPGATLRLVVAPDTSNERFRALLEHVRASIRSGPSVHGVYTVELATAPVAAVAWLRQQPEVRLVEAVHPRSIPEGKTLP